METKEEIWKAYTSAWSEPDRKNRLSLLRRIMKDDCQYQDMNTDLLGIEALSDLMESFQQGVPGGYFALQDFKSHHDKSLAKWTLMSQSGEKIQEGISYGLYTSEAKLQQMTGFFY